MKVKIKLLRKKAVMPTKAHPTDAGFDLTAVSKTEDQYGNIVYGTGLAFEIPEGYVGLLFPRSSNAHQELLLSNSVGVIDCHYRGEVTMKFKPTYQEWKGTMIHQAHKEWLVGERIGQLIIMPIPEIELEPADELSETDRGTGGYGSTGK